MQADNSLKKPGSQGFACGDTSPSRFRRTIAALEESWAAKARFAPFYPFLTWTRDGPKLGAATLVARRSAADEARLLALLSIAHGFAVPATVLKQLAWAEREFDRGDLAKSAMHVALAGLSALAGGEGARRLHIAAGILDHRFLTPLGLLKACGLDCRALTSLAKYDPDEPRVPKGNTDGGQWTRAGGGGPTIESAGSRRERAKPDQLAVALPEGCDEEWAWARAYCADLLKQPNPPRGLTGGHKTIDGCAKGFVSLRRESCPIEARQWASAKRCLRS
jgi:hypothetical protein